MRDGTLYLIDHVTSSPLLINKGWLLAVLLAVPMYWWPWQKWNQTQPLKLVSFHLTHIYSISLPYKTFLKESTKAYITTDLKRTILLGHENVDFRCTPCKGSMGISKILLKFFTRNSKKLITFLVSRVKNMGIFGTKYGDSHFFPFLLILIHKNGNSHF